MKQKGTILNVWDSGKSSDQEFRELIERTHNAKIIDSIEGDSWHSKIYIIWHKNYDTPTEGYRNYETTFDEGYLEIVQKEKSNLSRIFSYPIDDFKPYYNSWWVENELKKWEITLMLDKEFLPTKYSNSPSWVVIKIWYNNKSFEKIEDLLHMAGESPSIIDVRYLDFKTQHQKYNTLNKGENGYTMWIDDPHHPEISSHAMSVEIDVQKKAENFCKNILLHMVKKKI